MADVLLIDPDMGRVFVPRSLTAGLSLPGRPAKHDQLKEVGILFAKQRRAGELVWASLSHNERVDAGANQQAKQVFGGGSSPAAPSATLYPKVIAVANASLTLAKGDQSLGSVTASVTTSEFTTIGLSRVAAVSPVAGDYTAPATLGGQMTQLLAKLFTASGSGTAYGSGIFDSTTVSGSILYAEGNFSSTAVLVSADTLTISWSIQN